jgi:hypothetical protein
VTPRRMIKERRGDQRVISRDAQARFRNATLERPIHTYLEPHAVAGVAPGARPDLVPGWNLAGASPGRWNVRSRLVIGGSPPVQRRGAFGSVQRTTIGVLSIAQLLRNVGSFRASIQCGPAGTSCA